MKIAYLDGPRLRRSLLAASDYAQRQRVELNRINVFPVPDGDTGTNLSLTVRAITDHLCGTRDRDVGSVAREAAEAAVLGARGNCGMMLSHFLLGFAERVEGRQRISPAEFGEAMTAGAESLGRALERPVEGTILTVIRDVAGEAAAAAGRLRDFAPLVDHLLEKARSSLARTPDLLPVLRKAGVVDAGAKGFVSLLEGVAAYIAGDPLVALPPDARRGPARAAAGPGEGPDDPGPAAGLVDFDSSDGRYRYCTEGLVRGEALPGEEEVRERLRSCGDSLMAIRTGTLLKVHVHTDDPEAVFVYLRGLGTLVAHKAEDMRVQHDAMERSARAHLHAARRPVSIVTDSAHDLPEEVVRAHGIHVVPLLLVTEERVYRDGVDISSADFAVRLTGEAELPTTSQPAPADFLDTYRRAAEDGEEIVAVILGSSLSGTFGSAEAAAGRFSDAPVHLVDSLGASLLQGLLVMKAAELAEGGMPAAEVAGEVRRVRGRSGILFTVDTFDRLLASGRVGRGRAWLGNMLSVKPILAIDGEGRIAPVATAMGRRRVLPAMMEALEAGVGDGRRVRFGIVHVARPEVIAEVTAALRERWSDAEVLANAATPVLSTHLGPGAWGIAWLVEDADARDAPERGSAAAGGRPPAQEPGAGRA